MSRRARGRQTRWRVRPTILLALAATVAGGATRGSAASAAAVQEEPVQMEFRGRTMASAHENFFRLSGDTQDTIYAWAVDGRVTVRFDRSALAELYVEAGWTRYWTIGERVGAGGGLRFGRRSHVLWLRAGQRDIRPGFSVDYVVRTADILWAEADYAYRPWSDLELGADGRVLRVRFKNAPENESEIHELGGRVRWRGFGSWLSPEVGGGIGWQRAENPELEDTRGDLHARLISAPVSPLWMSARYRYRFRSYTGASATSSNYERWDEGGQWTLAAALRLSPHVQIDLHYDQLEMDSTRPERIFSARVATVGMTLRY